MLGSPAAEGHRPRGSLTHPLPGRELLQELGERVEPLRPVRPTVRRIRTVPDGTEGEKYANCETTITTTQHGRIGVGNNSCADA